MNNYHLIVCVCFWMNIFNILIKIFKFSGDFFIVLDFEIMYLLYWF